MQLSTTRFGTLDIDSDAVIKLTQPIIGFQDHRRFVLLPGPENSLISWLQSVESPELAFLLMDPHHVYPGYAVQLRPRDLEELAAGSIEELTIHTLVVVPDDPAKVRTNLRAPILLNQKQRLGKQMVLENSDYPIQYHFAQGAQANEEAAQEASNAGSDA